MEDLTGKQLGPYQVVAPLGEGGMAAVYKAYQPAMERYVALKILPRHFAQDPEFVQRFQREARLVAQLQHPHILPVFDFGQADGYTYLVMPFIPSGTLTDLLKGKPLPLVRVRTLMAQIGGALAYAHAHGLIHRDIKPSNVLLDESGNCLLTDFGLARMVEATTKLTSSGTVMGTPAYMSPEQGSGGKIDGRSDIYSLGVILYELVTGRVPYRAETPIAVIFKHIQDPLPPARDLNPNLPEPLERVILKALAKSPEDRYQTAGEMVQAIQAAIPEPASAPTAAALPMPTAISSPPPTVERPAVQTVAAPGAEKPRRALPAWAWGAIGVLALATIVGLAIVFGQGAPNTQAPASPTSVATVAVTARLEPTALYSPVPTVALPQRKTLKIVSDLPMSGIPDEAQAIMNAIRQALEARQSQVCNGAWAVEYEPHDSPIQAEANPDAVAANAKAYTADPAVVAVLGPYTSSVARQLIPLLNRERLIVISPSNTLPSLTKPGMGQPDEPDKYYPTGQRNYVRVVPTDEIQGRVAAQWAKELGTRSVYVLDDGSAYGKLIADVFRGTAQEIGLDVLGYEGFGSGKNPPDLARRLKKLGPDLIYLGGLAQSGAGELVRALRETGYDRLLMGPDGLYQKTFLDTAGPAAEGVYVTLGGLPPDTLTGQAAAWRDDYRARYGSSPTAYALYGYIATQVLLEALDRVCADGGSPADREAVRLSVLATRDFEGLVGRFSIDAQGDTTSALMSGSQVTKGAFRFVTMLGGEAAAEPLPGRETIPLSKLAAAIPWLPIDAKAVPGVFYYAFNVTQAPFDHPMVRRAFAAAVDRQAVVDLVVASGAQNVRPATSLTPPETLGRDLYGAVGVPFDPDRARSLLAEAGYAEGQGFPVVALVTNPGEGNLQADIAETVAGMWRRYLNVDVKIVTIADFKTYTQSLKVNPPGLFRMGWIADRNDPDNFLNDAFHSGAASNYGHFANLDFDQLVEQAAQVRDPAARQKLYIEAERLLCEQAAAVIPLFYQSSQR